MSADQGNFGNRSDSSILVDFDLTEKYEPELIFFDLSTRLARRVVLYDGYELDWYAHPDRYCIGYHIRDEYHEYLPCPEQQKIERGFQCDQCKKSDLLIPCILCKGEECHNIQSIKDICDNTSTSVYLVTFREEVKVGVSKKDRLLKRWLEQGAELASEVGIFPNGLIARAVEDAISWDFSLTKGIRIKTKFSRVKEENLGVMDKARFRDTIAKVAAWIGKYHGERFKGESTIHDLNSHYQIPKAAYINTEHTVALKGKFLGMKGPIFVINKFDQNFFFDVRSLRGRRVGKKPGKGSQGVLSDFF